MSTVLCPACNHGLGVGLLTREDLIARNAAADQKHRAKLAAWEAGDQKTRKPGATGEGKQHAMPFGCMCASNNCGGNPNGSGCFTCAQSGSCSMVADPSNPRGGVMCSCSICQCQCRQQWHSGMEQEIATLAALKKQNGGLQPSGEQAFGNFIGSVLKKLHFFDSCSARGLVFVIVVVFAPRKQRGCFFLRECCGYNAS